MKASYLQNSYLILNTYSTAKGYTKVKSNPSNHKQKSDELLMRYIAPCVKGMEKKITLNEPERQIEER